MKPPFAILAAIFLCLGSAHAQDAVYTNSVEMEFVLIHPGTMQVGVFQPTCPPRNQQFGQGLPQGAGPSAPNSGDAQSSVPQTAGTAVARRPQEGIPLGGAPGGGRGPGGRGGPGARPQDARNQWTEADYARCEELVKQQSSAGFQVTIAHAYYIAKFEVTQGQWKKVMATNPSTFQGDKVKDDADQHPVENVTWGDTQTFVKKLNLLEKTKLYHLPSEFEWEYACRAGGPGQTSWTDIRQDGWVGDANDGTTHVVGTKQPNAWGIYDMVGNVWEWVQDPYNEKIFPDAVPAKRGKEHVLKGGGFISDVKNAICATHDGGPGDGWDVGLRMVRDVR